MFQNKFQLLNTPENLEEIHWSSSDSSEYEIKHNTIQKITNKVQNRKRKRKKNNRNNHSQLEVAVFDVNEATNLQKSPILSKKHEKENATSPILQQSPQSFTLFKSRQKSPKNKSTNEPTSPILVSQYTTPKYVKKIKKSIFSYLPIDKATEDGRKSPVLIPRTRSRVEEFRIKAEVASHQKCQDGKDAEEKQASRCIEILSDSTDDVQESLDNTISMLKTDISIDLVKKVKSFFDSNFNSESISQPSIEETQTPKESQSVKTSEEDIDTFTQTLSNQSTLLKSTCSVVQQFSSELNGKATLKKPKYKKDGLAYRLNALIKKQNANYSLWHHERFLAANSNFVIPKGVHAIFRIRKFMFKYGCYLLDVIDINYLNYSVVINSSYVNNIIVSEDSILKIYEPYSIQDCYSMKLVVNVHKFEFISV